MRRVMVDTTAYSQAMRGLPEAVALLRTAEQLLICPIVLGELLSGFRQGRQDRENRQRLREFLTSPRVAIAPITPETSAFYADIVDALRRKGTPIPTNDIWIAASCMENGAHLATSDRHFEKIPGLFLARP